jgi:hypothetical protein
VIICLDMARRLACFFDDDRLIHGIVCNCCVTYLSEIPLSSEHVPVQQRYI